MYFSAEPDLMVAAESQVLIRPNPTCLRWEYYMAIITDQRSMDKINYPQTIHFFGGGQDTELPVHAVIIREMVFCGWTG